jgi:hypothetical protein
MASPKLSKQKSPIPEQENSQGGLVFDDYLVAIADVRKRFELATPRFGLPDMELHRVVHNAVETLIKGAITRHGNAIFTKPHPLIADMGDDIYSEQVRMAAYAGNRIHPAFREQSLRRLLELGLQSIAQLPSRYPARVPPQKQLRSLGTAFDKCAERAEAAFSEENARRRIELYFGEDHKSRQRLLGMVQELQWCSRSLSAALDFKVVNRRKDSPNPQVSLGMYFVTWIEFCTGAKHYSELTMLFEAAFCAAKKPTPRWVDRLAIEMNSKRHWRREWIKSISS